jgi:transcriptional regulator with XRE-family HTH domain
MENAELLRLARFHLQMTQAEMATAMGLTSSRTLQALEGGQNPVKGYHLAAAAHVVAAAKFVLEIAREPPSPGDVHRTDRMRELLVQRYGIAVANAVLGSLLAGSYLKASDHQDSFAINGVAGHMKLQDLRKWSWEVAGRQKELGEPDPCQVFIIGPTGIESRLLFETVDEALPTVRQLRRSDIDVRVAWPRGDHDDAIYAELVQLGAVYRS